MNISSNYDENLLLKAENYAAIYARQSNLKESHSRETQIAICKDVAKNNNLLVYKEYSEKISSSKHPTHERAMISELLNDAKKGCFKTVIVTKRDRLARTASEMIEIRNTFKKYGIKTIYAAKGEYNFQGGDNFSVLEDILLCFSQYEPNNISSRTMSGKLQQRDLRVFFSGGHELFVYKACENPNPDGKYTTQYILKETGKADGPSVVKDLFLRYIANKGVKNNETDTLLKKINSIYGINYECPTSIITKSSLAGLITKEYGKKVIDTFELNADTGLYIIKKDMYVPAINIDKPIISEDLWYEAVTIWRNNYKPKDKQRKEYLFKEVLFCKKCQKKIVLINDKYTCKSPGCTRLHEAVVINDLIAEIVKSSVNYNSFKKYIKEKIKDLNLLLRALNEDISEIRNLQGNEIRKCIIDNVNIDDSIIFRNLIEQENEKINQIRNIEDDISKYSFSQETLNQLLVGTGNASLRLTNNPDLAQFFLETLLEKVYIYGERYECCTSEIHYRHWE